MIMRILIGAGGHSRVVIDSFKAKNDGEEINGVIDINYETNKENELILGVPVIGGLGMIKEMIEDELELFCSIGDNNLRSQIFRRLKQDGHRFISIIHPTAVISKSAEIQEGVYVGAMCNIGPKAKIGRCAIVNTGANVEHESVIGDFAQIAPAAVVCGRANIGSSSFIGANATVLEKLSIGNNCVVGAGSVLIRSVQKPNSCYVGVPAREL